MSVKVTLYGNPFLGADNTVSQANIELVSKVAAQAKALCPVDKGQLRRSIMWKVPGQSGGLDEGSPVKESVKIGDGLVGSATEYAGYVEFGTRKQQAQPYLRPAVIIEVFGQNGFNTIKKEALIEMTKALLKGRKVYEG